MRGRKDKEGGFPGWIDMLAGITRAQKDLIMCYLKIKSLDLLRSCPMPPPPVINLHHWHRPEVILRQNFSSRSNFRCDEKCFRTDRVPACAKTLGTVTTLMNAGFLLPSVRLFHAERRSHWRSPTFHGCWNLPDRACCSHLQ